MHIDSPKKKVDFKANKWTFYFLNQDEIDFLDRFQSAANLFQMGEYAKVEVGITTGSNPFFTVPLSVVKKYNLEKYAKPLVGRSVQVPSVIFTDKDWINNRESDARTLLLTFLKMKELNEALGAREYIKLGEIDDIHTGYKCRIREEWQMVPSLRTSDALFIRRNNKYPKFIINEAQAYTTDTMHRVSVRDGIDIQALTASYYNLLSLAYTEICGRSHGGGVLELMPNEVEKILLPYNENNAELLPVIDRMVREKKDISDILKITNQQILKDNFGFTNQDIKMADSIWQKLSRRRLQRGR